MFGNNGPGDFFSSIFGERRRNNNNTENNNNNNQENDGDRPARFEDLINGLFNGDDDDMGPSVHVFQGLPSLFRLVRRQGAEEPSRPPAAKEVIDNLPEIKMTKSVLKEGKECAVCQDPFKVAEKGVTQLPCKHYYHKECVTPWLKSHNTCPICRKEFKTDNANYERSRAAAERRRAAAEQRENAQASSNPTSI
eukprot:UN32628